MSRLWIRSKQHPGSKGCYITYDAGEDPMVTQLAGATPVNVIFDELYTRSTEGYTFQIALNTTVNLHQVSVRKAGALWTDNQWLQVQCDDLHVGLTELLVLLSMYYANENDWLEVYSGLEVPNRHRNGSEINSDAPSFDEIPF